MRAHETLERAGRHGGFPARGSASGLLAVYFVKSVFRV